MVLELKSNNKDLYPICGIFIEGAHLSNWISVLDKLGLDPISLEVYGLPTKKANQIWGCLALVHSNNLPDKLNNIASAHMIGGKLVVPEKSKVIPQLTRDDIEQLFKDHLFVMHPEIGLFKLTEPISFENHIAIGELSVMDCLRPYDFNITSGKIEGFSIDSTPKEKLKQEFESYENRKKFENDPLSYGEKLRLEFYKKILLTDNKGDGKLELNTYGTAIQNLAKKLGFSGKNINERIIEDFRNLEERNKKEVEKLMDLLKDNPEEALRFAIPLEEHGYARGDKKAQFKMQDRGLDFSLFGGSSMSARVGGTIDLGDEYFKLRTQYLDSAKTLKEKGDYEKSAFIYLKLLKDYNAAGATLREGKKYEKAALIYLEYLKNERLAAECYEEGKIYEEAIKLYAKLQMQEKVGDLYVLLGSRKSANKAYQLQVDKDLENNQYVKAANLCIAKMFNLPYAQSILLKGWENKVDQYNCIRNYFNSLSDTKEVWQELERINESDVDSTNDTIFLRVLKDEYANQDENEHKVKDLAYSLISKLLEEGRISAQELLAFNKVNIPLRADTMRFELKKNKRMKK